MKPTSITTPLLHSSTFLHEFGAEVYWKMECYQPSGSFKLRGMDVVATRAAEQGVQQLVIASGGNAGYSLAYAAWKKAMKVKVFVPTTTPSSMIEKIRNLQAEVEVVGKQWSEANEAALAWSNSTGAQYVHAYDDPQLWEGYARIIDECANEMSQPDKIVVAVGGGGLLTGILQGMIKNDWTTSTLIAAETTGAASFAGSVAAGECITLPAINTIATSLGASKVAEELLRLSKQFTVQNHVVTDAQALLACERFLEEQLVLVEPACGAALSYVYGQPQKPGEHILVIVCGGVGMNWEKMLQWKTMLL